MSKIAAPYVMPKPSLGPCRYYQTSDSEACAAMITSVGDNFVTLAVYPPENRSFITRDGVRHTDDPFLKQFPLYENGTWDFTEEHELLLELAGQVADLEAALGVKK